MKRTWIRAVVVAALVAACAIGATAVLSSPAEAKGPCVCPQIYAPVECDRGKVYPNPCVADCRNAKNCVPVGIEL